MSKLPPEQVIAIAVCTFFGHENWSVGAGRDAVELLEREGYRIVEVDDAEMVVAG